MHFDKTVCKIYLTQSPFKEEEAVKICQEIDKANLDANFNSILLIINSGGGNDSWVMLHDYIKLSQKTVNTLACGWCASAGMQILQAGVKRYASKNTLFLVHRGNVRFDSNPNNFDESTKKWQEKENIRNKVLFGRSKIKIENQDKFVSFENQFNPNDALKFGFIDEII